MDLELKRQSKSPSMAARSRRSRRNAIPFHGAFLFVLFCCQTKDSKVVSLRASNAKNTNYNFKIGTFENTQHHPTSRTLQSRSRLGVMVARRLHSNKSVNGLCNEAVQNGSFPKFICANNFLSYLFLNKSKINLHEVGVKEPLDVENMLKYSYEQEVNEGHRHCKSHYFKHWTKLNSTGTSLTNDKKKHFYKAIKLNIKSKEKKYNAFIANYAIKRDSTQKKFCKKLKRNTASMIDEELIFFDGSDQSYGIFEAKWPLCEIPAVFQKNFTLSFTLDIASANLNTATGLLMSVREKKMAGRSHYGDEKIEEDTIWDGWKGDCENRIRRMHGRKEGNSYELKLVKGVIKLAYRKILKCAQRHLVRHKNNKATRRTDPLAKGTKKKAIYRFKLFQGLILTSAGLLKNEEWERVELRVGGNEKGGWIEVVVAGRLQALKSFSCRDSNEYNDDFEDEWIGSEDDNDNDNDDSAGGTAHSELNKNFNHYHNRSVFSCTKAVFEVALGGYHNGMFRAIKTKNFDKKKKPVVKNNFPKKNFAENIKHKKDRSMYERRCKNMRLCSMEPSFRGFMRNIKAFLFHARHSVAKQASSNSAFVTGQGVQVGGEELGG